MKYLKILVAFLLPLSMVACSDDDDAINSGSATIGFAQGEMDVKENVRSIQVPIQVSGDHNGLIEATVTVKDVTGVVMENDKTVILTSGQIRIPAGVETANVEIYLDVVTKEDNFDRSFKVEITGAKGASIGTSSCKINIQEQIEPYDKLMGTWTFNAVNAASGAAVSFTVVVSDGGDEANLEKRFIFEGFTDPQGYKASIPWIVKYNKTAGTLSLIEGETYNTLNFGFTGEVRVCPMNMSGGLIKSLDATWNETFDEIVFNPNGIVGVGVFRDGVYAGYWAVYAECSMKKN